MQIETQLGKKKRVNRKPTFPYAGTIRPFALTPIYAAPVLPGETMQSAVEKTSIISMPVKHPLAGAWYESWLVYVKLTDIAEALGEMFISDEYATTGYTHASDNPAHFAKSGDITWIYRMVRLIAESYFVDEGETLRTIGQYPQVKLNNRSWFQNLSMKPADEAVPVTDASDFYQHLSSWQTLQQMNLTNLTYEDYVRTYGGDAGTEGRNYPEILAYNRRWTKPVNVIDPTTGAPSSAWVWDMDDKLEKAKRFQEPGFIIKVATVRPKMFQEHVEKSMIGGMWGFSDWFPSYTMDDPTQRVKELLSTDTVFAAAAQDAGTENLIYDHADLLSHGEQFVNTSNQPYELPMSTGLEVKDASDIHTLRGEYCIDTDIDALFSGATAASRLCYYEGIANVVISGHVADYTP